MKKQKLLALLLALVMCLPLLAACRSSAPAVVEEKQEIPDETFEVTVDENGLATWPHIAPAYEYAIVDKEFTNMGMLQTKNNFVQLPEGFSVHVRPLHADGTAGYTAVSAYFGEPVVSSLPSIVFPDVCIGK